MRTLALTAKLNKPHIGHSVKRAFCRMPSIGSFFPASNAANWSLCNFRDLSSPVKVAFASRASVASLSALSSAFCSSFSLRACCPLSSLTSPAYCSLTPCRSVAWRVVASASLFSAASSSRRVSSVSSRVTL